MNTTFSDLLSQLNEATNSLDDLQPSLENFLKTKQKSNLKLALNQLLTTVRVTNQQLKLHCLEIEKITHE